MQNWLLGGDVLAISSDGLIATCSPDMGGRLLGLRTIVGSEVVVPTMPHSFEATTWPKAGAYPLIPYHNRISDSVIAVGPTHVALAAHPAALPHTLHGPGHTRPWVLSSHERSALSMTLDYDADAHWPWDFRAVQSYRLEGDELTLSLSLINLSETSMPAGLGWHPYFRSEEPVRTDAASVWPHRNDYLPTQERRQVANEDAESAAPTRYLEDWTEAHVRLTGGGTAIVSASPEFRFLVVHRGDQSHICVEPVTHVPNAWNMPFEPASIGARILQPSERLEGSICVRIVTGSADIA